MEDIHKTIEQMGNDKLRELGYKTLSELYHELAERDKQQYDRIGKMFDDESIEIEAYHKAIMDHGQEYHKRRLAINKIN